MTVSELLAASRASHEAYRRNVPHMRAGSGGKLTRMNGDPAIRMNHVVEALRLRTEAEALDPEFHDPAWNQDRALKHRHAELVNWYLDLLVNPKANDPKPHWNPHAPAQAS